MEFFGIFIRRDFKILEIVIKGVLVYYMDEVDIFKDYIDVVILCGGSMFDLLV